ncbi:glucosamine--fructose-6-phosphate aminotransferase (isomerizing) [Caldanaerobius fijiensis DSM 17918]|uniref:Glutamine--fructose-6-phosphate aminotransferase [isomerizing] n=1 Tax=Caldanaerobius fijiensis DSM 17918 TaxID=1121256 RepID=A0A1M4VQE8_9THEO|nr:glutamine--fructose-6-phosphate transaminase (isomerizing) [Caldanaerobius fijiensis]SHE71256.1 glucosamine--fructose-6-phosphate aminotransferase (isomerizing) [Caldanaerobius fijiensis DSM 17918]
MCGIVGYIGDGQATPILLEGLKRLEYRGYDSAGVALYEDGKLQIRKTKGRLTALEDLIKRECVAGSVGIGHTRWATHGEPSDINAHPHVNSKGTIAVVHNGIIENYMYLKERLQQEGYKFVSDTDTEVIAQLIDYFYKGDILDAVINAVSRLEGSYALAILSTYEPDKVIAVRRDSPLIVGLGEDGNYLASDIPAILKHTRNVYILEDGEIAVLTRDKVTVLDSLGKEIKKEVFEVKWDVEAAEKGGYQHFMLKEINEQPKAVRDTLAGRLPDGSDVKLDDIKLSADDINKINKIFIVACGTAYHAGLVGKNLIERLAKIPVEADIASEFRYRDPLVDEHSLTIVISQSGETADTLAAMREAKKKGSRILAVTNVVGSSVAREADDVLYTWAGPEIAVASTKAYTTQLVSMYLLAIKLGLERGTITEDYAEMLKSELRQLSEKIQKILDNQDTVQKLADNNYTAKDVFFLGRGLDYSVSMEGSLKLKEISYIHSEAYAAGELKHGTLALIENGTLVIALVTQKHLYDKMLSNIKEVTTRGAHVIAVALESMREIEKAVDDVIYIPDCAEEVAPVLAVIPLQLLAYYMAVARGCDVDKPRNLAKSVTVE